jgi:hypothetical protein
MRRPRALLCTLALALTLLASCSSDQSTTARSGPTAPIESPPSPATGSTGPTETTRSPTGATGSPVAPPPQPDVRLPDGMPAVVDDPEDAAAISAGDLTPLVPPGSRPGGSAVLARPDAPIDQVAVAWRSGDALAGRAGLIVWQDADGGPAWRAVYAFTDPKGKGVFGVRMDQADVTGDGIADLLTFEDVGGSGACGTYRVVESIDGDAVEILHRDVCDTEIQVAGGDLRVLEAVFEPADAHCCPSAVRTTVLRWNGSDWVEVSSEVSAAPGTP